MVTGLTTLARFAAFRWGGGGETGEDTGMMESIEERRLFGRCGCLFVFGESIPNATPADGSISMDVLILSMDFCCSKYMSISLPMSFSHIAFVGASSNWSVCCVGLSIRTTSMAVSHPEMWNVVTHAVSEG
jgi:hypothetical protein